MNALFRYALLGAVVAATPLHAAVHEGGAEGAGTPEGEATRVSVRLKILAMTAGALGARFSAALPTTQAQALSIVPQVRVQGLLGAPGLVDQLPLVGPVRRLAGNRWNTSDSSKPSDFALCYRLSRVMGVQIIPGDLTPAKLPTPKMLSVKTYGSGIGVMAGMTLRIGKGR